MLSPKPLLAPARVQGNAPVDLLRVGGAVAERRPEVSLGEPGVRLPAARLRAGGGRAGPAGPPAHRRRQCRGSVSSLSLRSATRRSPQRTPARRRPIAL